MAKKAKPAEIPREGVNTRITRDLRDKLDEAAAKSGRSVGSEIERRLENSFFIQEELLQFIAGKNLPALASIGICWSTQESTIGVPWNANKDTIKIAAASASAIVSAMAPKQDDAFAGEDGAGGLSMRDIHLGAVGTTFASLFRSLGKGRGPDEEALQRLSQLLEQTGVPRAPSDDAEK